MVDNNSGLYESSIISTVAIALIPIILWFARFGTIFPSDWRVKTFCYALVFACLLMPIGTEARTGLLCIALLGLLVLRDMNMKRRLLFVGAAGMLGLAAIPFLPSAASPSGWRRSRAIRRTNPPTPGSPSGAGRSIMSARRPFGGGFGAYRQNQIQVRTTDVQGERRDADRRHHDPGRRGPGLAQLLFRDAGRAGLAGPVPLPALQFISLVRLEMIRRRYRRVEGEDDWIAPLATSLQHFQLIYMLGSAFVQTAFQSFGWFIVAVQIGFDVWLKRRERAGMRRPFGRARERMGRFAL